MQQEIVKIYDIVAVIIIIYVDNLYIECLDGYELYSFCYFLINIKLDKDGKFILNLHLIYIKFALNLH